MTRSEKARCHPPIFTKDAQGCPRFSETDLRIIERIVTGETLARTETL